LVEGAEAPCVSLYLPTHRSGAEVQQGPIRFKNLLREAEGKLLANGLSRARALEILQPARALLGDEIFWQRQSDGLAVFLAHNTYRRYRLPLSFRELAMVGNRFHLTPLMSLLTGDGRFYILALSQNRVRILEASRHSVRELDPGDIPDGMADALGSDWEQRSLQLHSGATGRGVFHGHGAGEDDKEELAKFLNLVDNALLRLLDDRQTPLVVAAVGYLIDIYREVSKYPSLMEGGVEGNPDDRSAQELHARAWEVVKPRFSRAQQEAARRFRAKAGTGLVSADVREIVLAAGDGRVDTLFVAVNAHCWGRFDAEERTVEEHDKPGPDGEDLLDRAALESLLRGGTVYALAQEEMPHGALVAAELRY
jgi:hypothetical protein